MGLDEENGGDELGRSHVSFQRWPQQDVGEKKTTRSIQNKFIPLDFGKS